ncbi:beta-glucoside-specific PTS transporter subunit IIABC [Lactobacillus huangpiensis]|uniref:beta-glucoside-specific PTS transporter subunit IIABC n=1 Tax=Lactobacillus huangpiensis TaxID=2799571 RepID=UPI001CC7F2B9|nr:beta-glucoside-specific PTS transporter subunit IIABC [Lactobacillus huangpiensis]
MRSNKEVTDLIVENVGGANNISSMYHCATRIRFNLKDKTKFNYQFLREQPEIIGAVQSGEESQVIIGAKVGEYFRQIQKDYHISSENDESNNIEKNKVGWFRRLINVLVGIMAPIITALIAGGMFKVIISILTTFNLISLKSQSYAILSFMADAVFYFLPVMLAVSAAEYFKTNKFLSIAIAGVLLHPNWAAMVAAGKPVALFGIPVTLASYSSTVIPIILCIWIQSYVEKFAEKVSPNVIKTMLKPLLIFLIMAPLALILIGPIGSWLGNLLALLVNTLNKYVPWLVPTLMGTFTPLLVMVGMHVALTPLASLGFASAARSENVQGPGMLASNIAQAGCSFAIAVKDKTPRNRQIATSAGITALSGITEPALYGVTLKYKRALYAVMAAGGIAGFYAGITKVVRYSFGSPGIFTIVNFIGKPGNFVNAIITGVLGFVLAFVFTYLFVKIDQPVTKSNLENSTGNTITSNNIDNSEEVISAPVDGKVVALDQVNDEVFSSESLGSGVGIIPISDLIISPVNGKITVAYKTGHAIGITTPRGNEYLIHIGINTVNLKGKHFKVLTKEGQEVKKGDPLVQVDFEAIKKEGYDPTVMVIALDKKNDQLTFFSKDNVTIDNEIFKIN